MKICSKCHVKKPLEGFDRTYRNNVLRSDCKQCRNKQRRKRYKDKKIKKEGMCLCRRCNCWKNESCFKSKHHRRKTSTVICTLCRNKMKITTKMQECKTFWLDWKKTVQCLQCKNADCRLIQADHVRGKKVQNVSNYKWWASHGGVEAMKKELKKCQPLCAFCHRVKTKKEQCITSINKTWKRKSKEINKIKLNIEKCSVCKKKVTLDTLSAFDFDHINPEDKVVMISSVKRVKNESFHSVLHNEVKKCRLLCVNCHHIHTHYHAI